MVGPASFFWGPRFDARFGTLDDVRRLCGSDQYDPPGFLPYSAALYPQVETRCSLADVRYVHASAYDERTWAELKGSIGEGPNHSNHSNHSNSFKIQKFP